MKSHDDGMDDEEEDLVASHPEDDMDDDLTNQRELTREVRGANFKTQQEEG